MARDNKPTYPTTEQDMFSPVLNHLAGFTILGLIPVMPDMSVPALQSWYWEINRDPRGSVGSPLHSSMVPEHKGFNISRMKKNRVGRTRMVGK